MRRSALLGIALTSIIATAVSTGVASAHAARNTQRNGVDARSLFWPGHQVEPGLAFTDALLYGVTAISPNNAWAVGEQLTPGADKPLIEHWNGRAWSVVPSPRPVGAFYSRLKSVDAVSANNVWAVGDLALRRGGQRTLIEHWNGTSWHRVPSPNHTGGRFGAQLYAVSAISATDVWAVGYYDPPGADFVHSLAMHWNGGSWSLVRTPNREGVNRGLFGIDLPTTASGWAVGVTVARDGSRFRSLGEHWDGRRWHAAPIPSPAGSEQLSGVSTVAPGNVWAAGNWSPGGRVRQPLLMHRVEGDWRQVRPPGLGHPGELTALSADRPDDIWAVGSLNGRALLVHWDGSHWSTYHGLGASAVTLRGVTAGGADRTWAVGYRSGRDVAPVKERWNGHVWTR